jgi:hypothetical protein
MFPVPVKILVKTNPPKPIIDGKERSISPATITGVRAKAIIAVKGIEDIKAK